MYLYNFMKAGLEICVNQTGTSRLPPVDLENFVVTRHVMFMPLILFQVSKIRNCIVVEWCEFPKNLVIVVLLIVDC